MEHYQVIVATSCDLHRRLKNTIASRIMDVMRRALAAVPLYEGNLHFVQHDGAEAAHNGRMVIVLAGVSRHLQPQQKLGLKDKIRDILHATVSARDDDVLIFFDREHAIRPVPIG